MADLNWQLQNGLDYYARHTNPDLLHLRAAGRLLTLPWLIDDNLRHGRDIVLTRGSAQLVTQAFGDTWRIEQERRGTPLREQVTQLPRGTPFVLALLRAYRDVPLDADGAHGNRGCLDGTHSHAAHGQRLYSDGRTCG